MTCRHCGQPLEISPPEPNVGLAVGAACCGNPACAACDVDVWDEYTESLVDEDGHPIGGTR